MHFVTEIDKIRRKVLSELAHLAWNDRLHEDINQIPDAICTEEGPRYRCCVHKERAVVRDRIKLALGQNTDIAIHEAIDEALAGNSCTDEPVLQVLSEACDGCSIDKFIVTDACRNCVAHYCINNCPKNAIMVIQNRAHIDHHRCVECGLCKKNCPFGAIIEVGRPCERACSVSAVHSGHNRKAIINYDKCVTCGACKKACPFGAINDRSQIVQLITVLKSGASPVYALVAPAFVGQFGPTVKPNQIKSALKKVGFTDIREASFGADMVTLEETKEFAETVPSQREFITTSCCPAFVNLVEKHFPSSKDNISSTISPMIASALAIRKSNPEAKIVFIGPCIAKKGEAERFAEYDAIDFVLTFEEIAAVFDGAGIEVGKVETIDFLSEASQHGNAFARSGGVTQAVAGVLPSIDKYKQFLACKCDGLDECLSKLKLIEVGKLNANFVEGMACVGGCVAGPGTLMDHRVTAKLVENYAGQSKPVTSGENEKASGAVKNVDMHHHE